MRRGLPAIASLALAACICEPGAARCGDQCIDLASSITDCGACGHACAEDHLCTEGACVVRPGACVPRCGSDRTCVDGRCECTSGVDCGSACADLSSDPRRCGSCDNACATGASCVASTCECPSDAPDVCDGACIDTAVDTTHCGRCGQACAPSATCVSGSCDCPGALGIECDGTCLEGSSDLANCGACRNACELACNDGRCLAVEEVAIGGSHVVARMSDGVIWSWGYNVYCQLGDGTCSVNRDYPLPAYPLDGITQISAGQGHTCAMSGGRAYCWGWNEDGQLGVGTTDYAFRAALSVRLDRVTRIVAGSRITCALRDDHTAWCWGEENQGLAASPGAGAVTLPRQWGTFTDVVEVIADGEVCVRRSTGQVHCSGIGSVAPWPRERPEWNGATQVDVSSDHACALMAGTVSCAGNNFYGQIGNGTTSPSRFDFVPPTNISIGEPIVQIVLAGNTTCARAGSGRVYCWGSGSSLLTGPFGTRETPSPLAIPATTGSRSLVCGTSTCCVHFGGTDLRCWGNNYNGELADGTLLDEDRDTPYPIQW